jgi:ATP-binding cassette subfamily B protein
MRRIFVPEVIQSSLMDCGPAALKALFGGFGIYLSYDRLREACQTDVDGTSIDVLETLAQNLGLESQQELIPVDLVLLSTSRCLPAIAVQRLADGTAHFVVLWRVQGQLVQIMDPGVGRLWMHRRQFLASLYIHEQVIPAGTWEEWSKSEAFIAGLHERMRSLGVREDVWKDRAHQDASLRLAGALREARKLKRGAEAQSFLELCASNPDQIPSQFWTVSKTEAEGHLLSRGAVLLVVSGKRTEKTESLPESLQAVRKEAAPRVWLPVWNAIFANGWLLPALVALALVASAAGTVLEPLLFRGFFDLARHLNLIGQRMSAIVAMVCFLGGLLFLEWPTMASLLRMGRHLELRLRMRLLYKIPRLHDRHFQSRLISDMAYRAHVVQMLRQLPELAGVFVRLTASLFFAAGGIAWFYPGSGPLAAVAAVAAVSVPLLFQPVLANGDLRFREFSGALSRFYLDALLGQRPIRAHGASRTLRTLHAEQLRQWAAAGLKLQALFVQVELLQMAMTFAPIIMLVYREALRAPSPAGLLLLAYWAISIPSLGQQLASIALDLPAARNTLIRLLEPLNGPEEEAPGIVKVNQMPGVGIEFEHVTVVAGGHDILRDVSVGIAPGEHIAVIGSSGAGKSSLAGLLLGWHKPQQGRVRVDGAVINPEVLAQLRKETAWIAPEVHLFHSTLFENLQYGNGDDAADRVGTVIQNTDLIDVLEGLPAGLQTPLGEGGGLVSCGEGQNVRIARALARPNVRLALLDEPARGLDHPARQRFMATARRVFADATLIFITHDVSDTMGFPRVLVVDQGQIVEQGNPVELCEKSDSLYRALHDQDKSQREHSWSQSLWRRWQMKDGRLCEEKEVHEWTAA